MQSLLKKPSQSNHKRKFFLQILHLFQAINWTHLIETEQINNKRPFSKTIIEKALVIIKLYFIWYVCDLPDRNSCKKFVHNQIHYKSTIFRTDVIFIRTDTYFDFFYICNFCNSNLVQYLCYDRRKILRDYNILSLCYYN